MKLEILKDFLKIFTSEFSCTMITGILIIRYCIVARRNGLVTNVLILRVFLQIFDKI